MLISNIKLALSSLAERIDHGARAMSARRSGIISLQVNREELPVQHGSSTWFENAQSTTADRPADDEVESLDDSFTTATEPEETFMAVTGLRRYNRVELAVPDQPRSSCQQPENPFAALAYDDEDEDETEDKDYFTGSVNTDTQTAVEVAMETTQVAPVVEVAIKQEDDLPTFHTEIPAFLPEDEVRESPEVTPRTLCVGTPPVPVEKPETHPGLYTALARVKTEPKTPTKHYAFPAYRKQPTLKKFQAKPDVSHCPRPTPTYARLPHAGPNAMASRHLYKGESHDDRHGWHRRNRSDARPSVSKSKGHRGVRADHKIIKHGMPSFSAPRPSPAPKLKRTQANTKRQGFRKFRKDSPSYGHGRFHRHHDHGVT